MRAPGFSLIEVLVAITVLTVGVASLAQVFVLATRANTDAGAISLAAVLAAQKMEQLRALAWSTDALGAPTTDGGTDTAVVPEELAGGTGLSPSPADALAANTSGYCDFLDVYGRPLGGGTAAPDRAAYVRRWSIQPLPANPNNTLVLQVVVSRVAGRTTARLTSVKTRKAG